MVATLDVIIIGAGAAGAAVARELSKYDLNVAILEKDVEIGFGATKGTHAIIHCGIPYSINTPLRNRGKLRGCFLMEQVCKDLDVKYKKIGKLLVSFDKSELGVLGEVMLKAKRNGVTDIELITGNRQLKEMEPNLSDLAVAALYTKNTAIVSPWGLVHGLVENATDNGVKLYLDTEVEAINSAPGENLAVETNKGTFLGRYVVNAAGMHAEHVARLAGDSSFELSHTRQERMIMDKKCEGMVKHLVRAINKKGSGSDFVCPTVYGDIMVGVKANPSESLNDLKTTGEGAEHVITNYMKLVPSLSPSNIIKAFAGIIPQVKGAKDYWVRPSAGVKNFAHMVLGGSGLTSVYAMAQYLVDEVLRDMGLALNVKKDFNPIRKDIPHINELSENDMAELIKVDPRFGHIICRCETVSEGEIVEAIKRGARTVDGVKFRTRSGMGRCQGGFCRPRVIKILARELGTNIVDVTRRGSGSNELLYKAKELLN